MSFHLPRHLYRALHARERVVGVHQEGARVGKCLGIRAEGVGLPLERGDKGVRHRPEHRNAEPLSGAQIARTGEPGHVADASEGVRGIHPVSPPGPEIDHRPAPSGVNDPGCLGSQQGLVVHLVEKQGLDDLGLYHRRRYLDGRLFREEDRALRHGLHRASEAQAGEVRKEPLVEESQRRQVGELGRAYAKGRQVLQGIFEPSEHQVAAVGRQGAEEEAEDRFRRVAAAPVGLGHRKLVQVCEESFS